MERKHVQTKEREETNKDHDSLRTKVDKAGEKEGREEARTRGHVMSAGSAAVKDMSALGIMNVVTCFCPHQYEWLDKYAIVSFSPKFCF